ncbi:DUF2946 family protein [Roseateles sp.]|uniref:DUF2946 family protein n=1 Tax=Roseateles sp. TaxID=1971397 RepID=UPI0039EC85F4
MRHTGLPYRHATRTTRVVWVGLLVLALLLKVATPWLAASAAQSRGVTTADICSVYGVRTQPAKPADSSHLSGAHGTCALGPLLGAAPLPAQPPRAVLANLLPSAQRPPARVPGIAHDATLRWLTQRLHAPPARA